MTHPDTVIQPVSREIGVGVFATRDIRRGTIVWARDPLDVAVTPQQLAAFPPMGRAQLERYLFRDDAGDMILCWDNSRYMNHSCDPSNLVTPFGFSIAIRDLPAGAELTEDYATYHLAADEAFDCLCARPGCRGRVGPADEAALCGAWARAIGEALELVESAAQPLKPLVSPGALAAAFSRYRVPA